MLYGISNGFQKLISFVVFVFVFVFILIVINTIVSQEFNCMRAARPRLIVQGQPATVHLQCVATLSIPHPPRPSCTACTPGGPPAQQGRLQTVLCAATSPAQWHHQILQVLLAGLHE